MDELTIRQGILPPQSPTCGKTCGSKGCKGAIKKTNPEGRIYCPGYQVGGCVAGKSHTPSDVQEATLWLMAPHEGNLTWLNTKTGIRSISHLSSAPVPL